MRLVSKAARGRRGVTGSARFLVLLAAYAVIAYAGIVHNIDTAALGTSAPSDDEIDPSRAVAILDVDEHGVVVRDANGDVSGYDARGRTVWTERTPDYALIACLERCPDAVFSLVIGVGEAPDPAIRWRVGPATFEERRPPGLVKRYVVWARSPSDALLVESDLDRNHRLVPRNNERQVALRLPSALVRPLGSTTSDHLALASDGSADQVATFRRSTNGAWNSLGPHADLHSKVLCSSQDASRQVVRSAERSVLVRLTGQASTGLPPVSGCAFGREALAVFGPSADQNSPSLRVVDEAGQEAWSADAGPGVRAIDIAAPDAVLVVREGGVVEIVRDGLPSQVIARDGVAARYVGEEAVAIVDARGRVRVIEVAS